MNSFDKKQYMKEWRLANKARIAAREKLYWAQHPEKYKAKELRHREKRKPKVKLYKKAYRLKNLAECRRKNREWQQCQRLHRREYMRRYYEKHGEKMRKRTLAWYHRNPGKHSVSVVKRRRKTAECPLHEVAVINAWMKEVRSKEFARCYWCGTKVRGSDIHFDHVTPLSKGGTHSIGNLCASCSECNLTKHARLVTDWVANGQYFLNV